MEEKTVVEQEAEDFIHAINEGVTTESQLELAEKIQQMADETASPIQALMQSDESREATRQAVLGRKKNKALWTARLDKAPDKRGIGVTRKSKDKGKKSQKIAKNSRRKNRGK